MVFATAFLITTLIVATQTTAQEPSPLVYPFSAGETPSSHRSGDVAKNVGSFELSVFLADDLQLEWSHSFPSQQAPGRDVARGVAVDGDGNIYVAGYSTRLPYGIDIVTIKYNPDGDQLWLRRYDNGGDATAVAIAIDDNGDIIVAGISYVGGGGFLVLKYSTSGFLQWTTKNAKTAGGLAVAMVLDEVGNIYVTGYGGYDSTDYLTTKYSPDGVELWTARYDSPEGDIELAEDIAVDVYGNVFVTGSSLRSGGARLITIKYDSEGRQLWDRRRGGLASGIKVDTFGNIVVAGQSSSSETGADFITMKYSQDGDTLWTAKYDGPEHRDDYLRDLACDTSGNVYVTGESRLTLATVKYSADGIFQWADHSEWYEVLQSVTGNRILLDPTGAVYVAGTGESGIIKYSDAGERLWVKGYTEERDATGLVLDLQGNIILTGSRHSSADFDYVTTKFAPDGNEEWTAHYAGPGNSDDQIDAITVDVAGNAYMAGSSEGVGTESDLFLIKSDDDGNELWTGRYDGPAHGTEHMADMKVDQAGAVYMTGWSDGEDGRYDFVTLKYSTDGQVLWESRFSSVTDLPARPKFLAIDHAGNVFVFGIAYLTEPESYNVAPPEEFALIKYDRGGSQQWVARLSGENYGGREPTGLIVDDKGDIYLTFPTYSSETGVGIATTKFNSHGTRLWTASFDGPGRIYDWPLAMAVDHSGDVYVTGQRYNYDDYPTGYFSRELLTIKFSSTGSLEWQRNLQIPGMERTVPVEIAVDKTGDIIITGYRRPFGQGSEGTSYFALKYDAQGSQEWLAVDDDDSKRPQISGFKLDSDGNIYAFGEQDNANGQSYFISKFTNSGDLLWRSSQLGPTPRDIWVDVIGDIYVAGTSSGPSWSVFSVAKYGQGNDAIAPSDVYVLGENYPNPFNYATTIRYFIPEAARASIKIYNMMGQEIATLREGDHLAGWHEVTWGGTDLPSGLYFYRLQSGDFLDSKKLLFLK